MADILVIIVVIYRQESCTPVFAAVAAIAV